MKTSELIKKVEEFGNGLSVVLTNETLMLFADNGQTLICTVDDTIITTQKERFAVNSLISNAIELMFEYAKTPLEEREEEKKYYLRFPIAFNPILTYLGLSMRGYDCVGFDSSELYKKQFTQKEIDAMPFDTSFFIKEEI